MTLSRYLKLKIADDLSADAKYNLTKIDSLGATFITDSTELLAIRSQEGIVIEPASPDLGGTGNGTLSLGQDDNPAIVEVFSSAFRLRSALGLLNSTSGQPQTFLSLAASVEDLDLTLTVGLDGSNRDITFGYDGVVVMEDSDQVLTDKTISGNDNVLSDIPYSSLLLSDAIVDSDISSSAAIATSKLSGPLTDVVGNGLGTLAGQNSVSLTADVTDVLPIESGGTGATTASDAAAALLPSYASNANRVLGLNGTGTALEWKTFAAGGTVDAVTAPLTLSLDGTTVGIPVATSFVDGYLSATNWSTFNSKEPPISSGNTGQYWRGDKSWQTLDKAAVGLSNVDNTSDANKPISSAVSTALAGKYDASNPSAFIDAAGARSAVVVNSPAWTETTYAPSASAVAGYVSSFSGGSFSTSWTPAANPTFSILHSLNSQAITVTIYDAATNGNQVLIDTIDIVDNNNVSVSAVIGDGTTPTWTVVIKK